MDQTKGASFAICFTEHPRGNNTNEFARIITYAYNVQGPAKVN